MRTASGIVRAAAAKDSLEAAIAVTSRVWPEVAWVTDAPAWMANRRASLQGCEEGQVVVFDRQVGRGAALRAGWNDAAWGQPRREVDTAVAPSYERGYAGGLVFRQKREQDTSALDVLGRMPRVVPAG
ncbi:MAG: hypothetical protein M3P18_08485 [Actinomycetota bacterium]|nr:hypothetical protein [Actinomycetota bacterium]